MQSANGATGYFNQCNEILVSVTTTGAEGEVSGRIVARAWVDNIQPTQYVRRHYEIVPAENAEGAEGRVTLYFSQEDFDAFNTVSTTMFLPPLGNVANLLIEKRGGESSDGTGHPNTYPGAVETISDDDVVWNEEAQRWEISFDVNGFSGFFVKTTTSPLPVRWISFEGDTEKNRLATLYWKAEETNTNYYEIEKSFDGRSFYGIAQVPAAGHGIATYYFTDPQRLNGMAYYRIRQVDIDGTFSYSSIISLINPGRSVVSAYPNPIRDQLTLETTGQNIGTIFSLVNLLGVEVRKIKLTDEKTVIGLSDLVPGIYLLRRDQNTVLKLIKD